MSDPVSWYADPETAIEKRFASYRSIGFDSVRLSLEWRSAEHGPEGGWSISNFEGYFRSVTRSELGVKLILGVIMGPPKWFLERHPEARLTNQNGRSTLNAVSYWYPQLRPLVERKTDQLLNEILRHIPIERIEYVVVDSGAAGEPLYPPAWTTGEGPDQAFWCYDANAQADFRKQMAQRYIDIQHANKAWGTDFESWAAVTVMAPGIKPGVYWRDLLTWYRESKAEFVRWRAQHLRSVLNRKGMKHTKLLLYVPGTAYTPSDWESAVRDGSGNENIRMMNDWDSLIDVAAKFNCELQYTGAENEAAVRILKQKLRAAGCEHIPIWAENAGVIEAASDPKRLTEIILRHNLRGLDYTHANFIFEADRITPNKVGVALSEACSQLRKP